jgi:hypothetical protein
MSTPFYVTTDEHEFSRMNIHLPQSIGFVHAVIASDRTARGNPASQLRDCFVALLLAMT